MATRPTKRERDLAREIEALEDLADGAKGGGAWSAAVKARAEAGRLRKELARLRDERLAASERDPVKRTRRLRRAAAQAGSWVAASQLLRHEQTLEVEAEAKRRAAEEAAAAEVDEEAMLDDFAAGLDEMPDSLVEELLDRIAARLARADEALALRVVNDEG